MCFVFVSYVVCGSLRCVALRWVVLCCVLCFVFFCFGFVVAVFCLGVWLWVLDLLFNVFVLDFVFGVWGLCVSYVALCVLVLLFLGCRVVFHVLVFCFLFALARLCLGACVYGSCVEFWVVIFTLWLELWCWWFACFFLALCLYVCSFRLG